MANKKGLSGPMEDFADITSPENEPRARYGHDTTTLSLSLSSV